MYLLICYEQTATVYIIILAVKPILVNELELYINYNMSRFKSANRTLLLYLIDDDYSGLIILRISSYKVGFNSSIPQGSFLIIVVYAKDVVISSRINILFSKVSSVT